MKRTILFFVLTLTFFSCSKDPNNLNNTFNNGFDYMTAYINGSGWGANGGYAQSYNGSLTLYGVYNNASSITIVLSPYNGQNTYTIGGFNTAVFYDGNGNEYQATSGILYLTADDGTTVHGTFSFSGVGNGAAISITNGTFNLSR